MQQIIRKAYLNLRSLFILNKIKNIKTGGGVHVKLVNCVRFAKEKGQSVDLNQIGYSKVNNYTS